MALTISNAFTMSKVTPARTPKTLACLPENLNVAQVNKTVKNEKKKKKWITSESLRDGSRIRQKILCGIQCICRISQISLSHIRFTNLVEHEKVDQQV